MGRNQYSIIAEGKIVSSGPAWRRILEEFLGQRGVIIPTAFCINDLMLCFPMGQPARGTGESQFGMAGKNYREFTQKTGLTVGDAHRVQSGGTSVKSELSALQSRNKDRVRIDFALLDTPAGRGAGRLLLWVDATPFHNLQAYAGMKPLMEDTKLIEQIPLPPWAVLK